MKSSSASHFVVTYLVTAYLAVPSIVFLTWRTKGKPPRKFQLLRGPGESLRRRMEDFHANLLMNVTLAVMGPLGIAVLIVSLWAIVAPHTPARFVWPVVAVIAFGGLIPTGIWLGRKGYRFGCDQIGYLGERAVGEALQGLGSEYRVFHDVPAEGNSGKFNLDHVVVGPTGVCLIEVKTKRKTKLARGRPDHIVSYDGEVLNWPWGPDRNGTIDQVRAEFRWMREWLIAKTHIRAEIRPVLVLPGWYVKSDLHRPLKVVNEKVLCRVVRYGPCVFSLDEISRIADRLDEVRRDVKN